MSTLPRVVSHRFVALVLGPKARPITAWGIAPGTIPGSNKRAEGPTYPSMHLRLTARACFFWLSFRSEAEESASPALPQTRKHPTAAYPDAPSSPDTPA